MNDKIKSVLGSVIEQFQNGNIPEVITIAMFPFPNIPCSKWSLLNRTIMFLSGTMDARGFNQWHAVNRYVQKGSKAIYILVPYIKKVGEKEGDEQQTLYGFGLKPVFKVEDTDGEQLEYEQLQLPDFPLMERAKEWGVSIKAVPGNYRYLGYFSADRREIALATAEEKVFFHELAHCAHSKIIILKSGQDPIQEVVAELSASVLCRMVGKTDTDTLGNSYRYISRYAEKLKMSAVSACLKVMSDTEKVLNLILQDMTPAVEEERKVA